MKRVAGSASSMFLPLARRFPVGWQLPQTGVSLPSGGASMDNISLFRIFYWRGWECRTKPELHRPGPAMDEQAGPGVLFSNNSGGNIKAPLPCDVGGGEATRAQYSIPGILHFLQHEWARFEVEKAQWEVERAELQVTSLGLRCFHWRTLFCLLASSRVTGQSALESVNIHVVITYQ